jgi:ribose transport system permease protein
LLTRTTPGHDIYAIGGNKQAALLSGVPVDLRLNTVYAMSGFMSAVAAVVLAGRMNSGLPLAGMGAELDSIAAVIIGGASFFGGVGTVGGTLVGALIIGVLRNGLNLLSHVQSHGPLKRTCHTRGSSLKRQTIRNHPCSL